MIARYSKKIKVLYTLAEIIFWLIIKLLALIRLTFYSHIRKKNSHKKILLFEPYQMGDVISLSLLLDPLNTKFPDSEIFILCKTPNFFEADNRVNGIFQIDFVWTKQNQNRWKSIGEWLKMLSNLKYLRQYNFDIGIETRGDIRSQFILNFIGAKQIIGYNQANTTDLKNFGFLVNKSIVPSPKYKHRFEWNLYLLTVLGIEENLLFPMKLPSFRIFNALFNEKYILIHIGAGWEFKRWRNEKWMLLIEKLLEKYDFQIKIIGGEKEKNDLDIISERFKKYPKIISQTTDFQQLTSFIYHSETFVCLDSGPQNLASCLNKKVIALFGPGHSDAFRPYHQESRFIHKIEGFSCHPCFQQKCIFPQNSCMDKIEVNEVFEMIISQIS